MEQHLPATREEAPIERAGAEGAPVEAPEPEQDVSIILLPFAIVVFLVLSFTAAAWTLIASIGG